jgi:uncharacterized surface protein with fasciclin (FAS1) repeats
LFWIVIAVAALQAADLVGALTGAGPFTVVAPTNDAFNALGANVVARLLQPGNKDLLTSILTYHVVAGAAVKSTDLKDHQVITTLEGRTIEAFVPGAYATPSVFFNGAQVVTADLVGSNGVVHKIDAVLLPPDVVLPLTVADQVKIVPALSTLCTSSKSSHDARAFF